MKNFCNGFFFKNYNNFKSTRSILDAVVLTDYLTWNKNLKNFFEIGVYKGANFSIVRDARNDINCILNDVNFEPFYKNIPAYMRTDCICLEMPSIDIDYTKINSMDFVSWDGDPIQPTPVHDLENIIKYANHHTIISLSYREHPHTMISRNFLASKGWTLWLEMDNSEWWTKTDLQPFINHLLDNKQGILNFGVIIKGSTDDTYKWKLTSPQFVYDNVQLLNQYIKDN